MAELNPEELKKVQDLQSNSDEAWFAERYEERRFEEVYRISFKS